MEETRDVEWQRKQPTTKLMERIPFHQRKGEPLEVASQRYATQELRRKVHNEVYEMQKNLPPLNWEDNSDLYDMDGFQHETYEEIRENGAYQISAHLSNYQKRSLELIPGELLGTLMAEADYDPNNVDFFAAVKEIGKLDDLIEYFCLDGNFTYIEYSPEWEETLSDAYNDTWRWEVKKAMDRSRMIEVRTTLREIRDETRNDVILPNFKFYDLFAFNNDFVAPSHGIYMMYVLLSMLSVTSSFIAYYLCSIWLDPADFAFLDSYIPGRLIVIFAWASVASWMFLYARSLQDYVINTREIIASNKSRGEYNMWVFFMFLGMWFFATITVVILIYAILSVIIKFTQASSNVHNSLNSEGNEKFESVLTSLKK